jgi:hypothetical protein
MTTRPGYVWDATASEWVEIGQAAVVSPFKYQTSQPSSPATGDIWIDSDDEVPSVDSTLYYRWTKTMSGGETSLSGTDNNSLALKYTPGYESVFINGVLQVRGSDYVATTGTTVTGLTALTASDVVMVESIIAYSVGDTYTQTTLNTMFSPITTTGLVLITSATVGTAVSSITVNSAFSAAYENYRVIYSGGAASGNGEFYLTLGGITSGYSSSLIYASGSTPTAASQNSVSSWFWAGTTNGTFAESTFEITNPFDTKSKSYISSLKLNSARGMSMGFCTSTASATAFTLTPTTGTITGGTIKVYGYK